MDINSPGNGPWLGLASIVLIAVWYISIPTLLAILIWQVRIMIREVRQLANHKGSPERES